MHTLEVLLILLLAKPKIFLLPSSACLLNSLILYVALSDVLTKVYPEFTWDKQVHSSETISS